MDEEINRSQQDDTSNTGNGCNSVGYEYKDQLNLKISAGQQYLNVDLGSERPVLDGFEDNLHGFEDNLDGTTQNPEDINNINQKKWNIAYLWEKCFHCLCPFLVIFRALLTCDMETFWKIVPSILVTKAFYSSCVTLGLCTLFKVQRVTFDFDTINEADLIQETYFFGLWTYTRNVDIGNSLEDFVKKEVERIETCSFHMNQVDDESPDRLFLNDAAFNIARTFAITATLLGFFSMISLFLTAANYPVSCRGPKIWLLFNCLLTCGILQSFTFLVFVSSVCTDSEFDDHRGCSMEDGAGFIFTSSFCWWFAAFASLKMPNARETEEGIEGTLIIKGFVDPTINDDGNETIVSRLPVGPQKEGVKNLEQMRGACNSDDETTSTISLDHSPYC